MKTEWNSGLNYLQIEEGTSDMIAIIDYDAGNIKSVEKALQKLGEDGCESHARNSRF